MNQKLLAFVLALSLSAQFLSPHASLASTSVVIPGTEASSEQEMLNQQQMSDIERFLEEFSIVKKCLRNRPDLEQKPLNALTGVCAILQVFDEQAENMSKTWEKALKIKLIDAELSKTQKLKGLEFLRIAFQAAGVTISPLSESNYQNQFKKYRIRMTPEEFKIFAMALEQGLIPEPGSAEEVRELRKKLTSEPLTIAQGLAYLYQISTSQHHDTIINILPPQISSPSLVLESTLKEIITTIKNQSYFSQNFDEKAAMEAAIKAAIKTLEQDKYIEYYTEEEFQSFSNSLNGNLEGIGAYIEEKEGQIIIVSPIEGSPAAKAGILPGDIILFINGESTENLSLQQAVDKIRGPQGTTVKLKIQRPSQQLEITITREKIVVPAISVSNRDGIEIIKVVQFGNTSAEEMRIELESIAKKNPQAIIIDLRNNPGGFLDQVVTIVDYFIGKNNPIVYLKDRQSSQSIDSTLDPIIKNIPIAILINKGSASASEILAGALQSYGIAKVYGETSFGKGTVQNVITLQDPNDWIASAFKFTTSEYLVGAPNGKMVSIDGIGVKPLDNPNGPDTPLLDDRETAADEALDAVINLIKNPTGSRHR